MTGFELIPMSSAHVFEVATLERHEFSNPWSERTLCSELNNPYSFWVVAVRKGSLLGYIGAKTAPPEADMMKLAVVPEARRQGVASALIREMIHTLAAQGITAFTLEVRPSNTGAVLLYEMLGFARAGIRPGYYFHPKEDAFILRKEWTL